MLHCSYTVSGDIKVQLFIKEEKVCFLLRIGVKAHCTDGVHELLPCRAGVENIASRDRK